MQQGLSITLKCSLWQTFAYFCNPVVEIDGHGDVGRWGTRHFELPVGKHKLRIFFPYLHVKECGYFEVEIDVMPDQVIRLLYEVPSNLFYPGIVKILD